MVNRRSACSIKRADYKKQEYAWIRLARSIVRMQPKSHETQLKKEKIRAYKAYVDWNVATMCKD